MSMWASLVEGFNTPVSAGGLNLPDKRVDPGCWLRSGFESPLKQLCIKPLSGSYQLWTLHWGDIICALLGLRDNELNPIFNVGLVSVFCACRKRLSVKCLTVPVL